MPPRQIQSIVWHSMEGLTPAALAHWNTGAASAHLCVKKNGVILLSVKIEDTAWHAGTDNDPGSGHYGRTDFWRTNNINAWSIGVELEGYADARDGGFTQQQITACVKIAKWGRLKYGIRHEYTLNMIQGHHLHGDISSSRTDPGPTFPLTAILDASA